MQPFYTLHTKFNECLNLRRLIVKVLKMEQITMFEIKYILNRNSFIFLKNKSFRKT